MYVFFQNMEQWMSNSRNSSCNFFDAIEAPPVSSIERKLKRKVSHLVKFIMNFGKLFEIPL